MEPKPLGLALFISLAACTPVPPRPADPSGKLREDYEACEREHARCLSRSQSNDSAAPAPALSESAPPKESYDYGYAPSCNAKLKTCYDSAQKKH